MPPVTIGVGIAANLGWSAENLKAAAVEGEAAVCGWAGIRVAIGLVVVVIVVVVWMFAEPGAETGERGGGEGVEAGLEAAGEACPEEDFQLQAGVTAPEVGLVGVDLG